MSISRRGWVYGYMSATQLLCSQDKVESICESELQATSRCRYVVLCVCVCACMHTCVCVCVCVCVCACVCVVVCGEGEWVAFGRRGNQAVFCSTMVEDGVRKRVRSESLPL